MSRAPSTPGTSTEDLLLAQLAAAPPIEPDFGVARLEPGTMVGGRYRIEAAVGQGGMGVVYRARDIELERRVAIKLHSRRASDTQLDSLMGEAKVMARLSHPYVLTVYEVGRHTVTHALSEATFSRLYIAMEYASGGTLRDWLEGPPRPWREVVEVFERAARGLAAAHRAGVIHRDFKPDNVLMDQDGRPRVADFGVAHMAEPLRPAEEVGESQPDLAPRERAHTTNGVLRGTLVYMAPEQLQGRTANARSDQYAFCVSLHEALFGVRPFEGAGAPAVSGSRRAMRPGRDRRAPRRVRRLLMRGLAVDPADRFTTMDALVEELRAATAARARRWGMGVFGAGAALLAVGLWPEREVPCEADSELREHWDDGRRDVIADAFAATQGPYATASAVEVTRRLDQYADSWLEERRSTCPAALDEPGLMGQKRRCLARRLGELSAYVDVLIEADRDVVRDAALGVGRLTPPSDCERPEVLAAERGSAPDLDDEAVARFAQEVAELRARVAAGAVATAWPRILALQEQIDDEIPLGLRRDAAVVVRDAASLRNALTEARRAANTAVNTDLAAGDEVRLAVDLAWLAEILTRSAAYEDARERLQMARAAASSADARPSVETRISRAAALLAWRGDGDLNGALAHLVGAHESVQALHGEGTLEELDVLARLAAVQTERGKPDEAKAYAQAGLDIVTRRLGPQHPSAATFLNALGLIHLAKGEGREGSAMLRRAAALFQSGAGRLTPRTITTLHNVANALLARSMDGDEEAGPEAVDLLRRLIEDNAAFGPAGEGIAGELHTTLGQVLLMDGEPEEGLEHLERGVELLARNPTVERRPRLAAMSGLAEAYANLGRHFESVEMLERAIATPNLVTDVDRGRLFLQYAMRLNDAGRYEDARDASQDSIAWLEKLTGPESSLTARAYVHLGRNELALRNAEAGLVALERALAIARAHDHRYPSQPGLLYLIALAHTMAGHGPETRAVVDEALAIWPQTDDASYGSREKLLALVDLDR